MDNSPIILFDGVCNFCNSAVNFIIRRNKNANIFFTAMQSQTGQKILQQYGLPVNDMQSFVLIENGKAYKQSTAALRICRHLKGLWPLCYGFIIVPAFIRNAVYNWIAKNRYKWFGKRQQCMIPTPEVKARFLN
ncbi:MAG: thiol-disulfide oxidoreductase DCC family protein [Ferruginibacter sp.]|nr:thiol-disulfide oxidoreductase DCC family protein [Bacteroidota bacterium]MBX2917639.1 thiol-disulfide oxidoreductase DCC family protein [Ferruginibacter sp.]MCB0709237.1 thiol-disulfide oxidoreductase DCC family protein [Chitinophagaceae bacterium]MCC7379591.1 thiol-disulfide oxidoreductase DCC family protein [Chitinophagaceae bacterium]